MKNAQLVGYKSALKMLKETHEKNRGVENANGSLRSHTALFKMYAQEKYTSKLKEE